LAAVATAVTALTFMGTAVAAPVRAAALGEEPVLPASCTISRLPVPVDLDQSLVTGADPTGRYLLGRAYPHNPRTWFRQVLIWDNGTMQKVDLPGVDQALTDITSTGVAVGSSYYTINGQYGPRPWLLRDGQVTQLPGVDEGDAKAINELGAAVGNRRTPQGLRPVLWTSTSTPAVDLPLPEGVLSGDARGINEDGVIIGNVSIDSSGRNQYPIMWSADGTVGKLPLPSGATSGMVHDFAGDWATGWAAFADDTRWVRWNVRTGAVQAYPEFSAIDGANSHGWLVGQSTQWQALLASDSGSLTLPDLYDHSQQFDNIATTISDDGRLIAGQANDSWDKIRAVVWHCS
jgi:uncharacterized membrane protein